MAGAVSSSVTAEDEAALGAVLDHVQRAHGVDFRGYRASTVLRRVRNRMIAVSEPSITRYLERLRRDAGETSALVGGITIKVSRFFRNAQTFEVLRRELRARVLGERGTARPLRIWSAGAGRGEEPYSLAALLEEIEAPAGASVLATDVDPEALGALTSGHYPEAALSELAPGAADRHLRRVEDPGGEAYEIRPHLRRRVRCAIHDLTAAASPPVGGPFHLVSCRNVLIYLRVHVQERVQRLLRDAIAPGGILCLGEAEWLVPAVAADFSVVDRRARVFERRPAGSVP